MQYYKQIDSFRFFAAFLVLIAHWLHGVPYVNYFRLGSSSVEFFFVVSGFLITYQLFGLRNKIEQNKVKLKKAFFSYTLRRALRIFPLYYFIVFLATTFNGGQLREAFLYNLTYTTNFYFIKTQGWSSVFSHFWSLSVEEHFYLVWPIIVLACNKKIYPYLFPVIILAAVAFRYFRYDNMELDLAVYIHTISCLDLFMFGAVLAYFLYFNPIKFKAFFQSKITKRSFLIGSIGFYLFFLSAISLVEFKWVFSRSIFGIFFALSIGFLVLGIKGRFGRFLENKWLVRGGKISYAIYLIHNFVPGMLLGIKQFNLPMGVEFVIYLIFTLVASDLLHRFLENPMRKFGNRFRIVTQ